MATREQRRDRLALAIFAMLALIVVGAPIGCTVLILQGIAAGEEIAVPQEMVGEVQLLAPERRLPPSATNVRTLRKHFQDTLLFVRFDAPLGEARAFVERITGQAPARGALPFMSSPRNIDWWLPDQLPPIAEGAESTTYDADRPHVKIVLIPRGSDATVSLLTFTT